MVYRLKDWRNGWVVFVVVRFHVVYYLCLCIMQKREQVRVVFFLCVDNSCKEKEFLTNNNVWRSIWKSKVNPRSSQVKPIFWVTKIKTKIEI